MRIASSAWLVSYFELPRTRAISTSLLFVQCSSRGLDHGRVAGTLNQCDCRVRYTREKFCVFGRYDGVKTTKDRKQRWRRLNRCQPLMCLPKAVFSDGVSLGFGF